MEKPAEPKSPEESQARRRWPVDIQSTMVCYRQEQSAQAYARLMAAGMPESGVLL